MADNVWYGDQALQAILRHAVVGLNRAADYLLQESQSLAPEETGALEESARTHKTNVEELASQVQYLKYYAVWQHEKIAYHHTHGQAKFLERPLIERSMNLQAIIATEISRGL